MNILLITSRYLPIFNKNNEGAIEKLERIYLEYNEKTKDHFTVYSPKIAADNFDNKKLNNTIFRPIDQTTLKYKIAKYFYAIKKRLIGEISSEAYIRAVTKDLKKRGELDSYDLILFENGEQDIPVFKKLTKTKTRIALHLHNDYINKETKNSQAIIESCDEIWTVSDFVANRINEVKKTKTITISNTIDFKNITKNEDLIKKLQKQFDSENNIIFIYIGRFLKSKGILQLLKAFDAHNKVFPNSKLLLLGKTEKNFAGKKLQKILDGYTQENKNIIPVGFIEPTNVINYQSIADCQIIPSICNEAFGLVILEAMAANLKIIATKIGGIPEIGKETIAYVDKKDMEEELLTQMSKITKEKLPQNYYMNILKKHTTEKFVNNIYAAIHNKEQQ